MNRPRSKSSTADLIGSRLFRDKRHFRVVLLGSTGVGKTCIVSRLLYEKFVQRHKATIDELHSGIFEINGVDVTLELLDTSGSFEFPAMRRLSIMTGDGFMLVFAMNDKSSFDKINELKEEIFEVKGDPMTPIVVIGNKSDLCLQFTSQEVYSDGDDGDDDNDGGDDDGDEDDDDETKLRDHFLRYSADNQEDGIAFVATRNRRRTCSLVESSSSSYDDDDVENTDDGKVIKRLNLKCQKQDPQRRGSIFNNGNSALEKFLLERSLREQKCSAKKKSNFVGDQRGKVEVKFRTRRKYSEGTSFAPDADVIFGTHPAMLLQQLQQQQLHHRQQVCHEIDPLKNLQDHHYHHQLPQKYQKSWSSTTSRQSNYQHPGAPRRSLPLHCYYHQQQHQQQQQLNIQHRINANNQNLQHQQQQHQQQQRRRQQQPESRIVSRRNPFKADLKLAESLVSSECQQRFIRISAKNDSDVSTVIFKALLSEVGSNFEVKLLA